jgi:ribonuclease BN (tRNA processing enzyme)
VKLTVLGCSPAWPNPGGAHSGYLVEGAGRLLLDCGPGVLARLRERHPPPWPQVDAIVLSHLDLDHCGDLVSWVWGVRYGPGWSAPQPALWIPAIGRQRLAALGAVTGVDGMFGEVFAFREYESGRTFRAAGFDVTPFRLPHGDESHGLRIEDEGHTLAYSGDSGPSPELEDLARDADLLLCEATAGDNDEHTLHLSAADAITTFRASGARRLVLTHRPNELPPVEGVELAREGLELEL